MFDGQVFLDSMSGVNQLACFFVPRAHKKDQIAMKLAAFIPSIRTPQIVLPLVIASRW
jgi:hypothetical protein